MSGALNSVFGGGNIFGALMSIASIAFPPMALAGSLSNLLVGAIGTAIKGAVDTMVKELGMPRFVGEMAKGIVDQFLPGQMRPTNPAVDSFVAEKMGGEISDFSDVLMKNLVDAVKSDMKERAQDAQGSSSKRSAGSWLELLARNLGEVLAEKTEKMVDLGQRINDLTGNDDKSAAKEMTGLNSELQGVAQIAKVLTETLNTVVKGIGDALSAIARKQ